MKHWKWKVASEPTGRYRSFEKRDWPTAYWPNEKPAFKIYCDDAYTPRRARGESAHGELKVMVAHHKDEGGFEWKMLKKRAATLVEAKQLAEDFIKQFPDWAPPQYRSLI